MATLAGRMLGAATLNARVYEDVEADTGALGQALAIVLLSSLAAGVGWMGFGEGRLAAMLILAATAVAGWVAWAVLIYIIGTRLLPEPQTRTSIGELLRALGFAQTPGIIRVLGVIPGVAPVTTGVAALWMLAATVVAVRQALDYGGTGRAVAVCVVGWALALIMFVVIGLAFAPSVS